MKPTDNDRPMFSTIMPIYNHVQYVGESIESVLAQTFEDCQLVLVDDGSTDGSAEVIDEFAARDGRIVAIHQENAGPAVARNTGLARATGRWLTYLDSDDLWYPDALQNFADFIAEHPDVGFIYGYRHRIDADGNITELPGKFQDRVSDVGDLFQTMYLSHLCVCYRRELMDAVGGYEPTLRSAEDYELYLRMGLHTKFTPLGKPTGLRRRHDTNISRASGAGNMQLARILSEFYQRVRGDGVLEPAAANRRIAKIYYRAGREFLREGKPHQAVDALRKSRQYKNTVKTAGLTLLAKARSLLPSSG